MSHETARSARRYDALCFVIREHLYSDVEDLLDAIRTSWDEGEFVLDRYLDRIANQIEAHE